MAQGLLCSQRSAQQQLATVLVRCLGGRIAVLCATRCCHAVLQTPLAPPLQFSLGSPNTAAPSLPARVFAPCSAREAAALDRFRTEGGSAIREHCKHLTKEACRKANNSPVACPCLHFQVGANLMHLQPACQASWPHPLGCFAWDVEIAHSPGRLGGSQAWEDVRLERGAGGWKLGGGAGLGGVGREQ